MIDAPPDWDRVARITWLHLVRNGRSVEVEDFKRCIDSGDTASTLSRNASGTDPDSTPHDDASPGALAVALVSNPTAQDQLPILPAFPGGAALNDPEQYRTWLLHKPGPNSPTAQAAPSIFFVIQLDRPEPAWLAAAIATILAQPSPEIEIALVTRKLFARAAWRQAVENPRLRLLPAKVWQDPANRFNHALIGQHDRLSATAVAELATSAATADVIPSNDDAMDANGLRHSPRPGTAWDRVLVGGCPGLMLARTALPRITAIVSRRDPVRPHGTRSRHRAAARRHLAASGQNGCTVQARWNGAIDAGPVHDPTLIPDEARPQPHLRVA